MQDTKPFESILDKVDQAVESGETDLKSLLESFGNRAFGPVLILTGLFLVTPIGMIPGLPVAVGIVIMAFAGQLLAGRKSPWIPRYLTKLKITKTSIDKTHKRTRPILKKVDAVVHPRLHWAAGKPAQLLAALICIILALSLFPLGVVPFGVVIPGAVILLFGLGLTARDGIFMLAAFTLCTAGAFGVTKLSAQVFTQFMSAI